MPVGPVHAGIIEPGHFLFSVAGEPVLYLQIRLFYTHKGTEKLFENMSVTHGVRLANEHFRRFEFCARDGVLPRRRTRGASGEVPPRARALRTVCLELERLYNHVADIGAIATDVAFVVANAHAMRLKEKVLRLNEQLTGNRLLRGMACLGGVRFDWNAEQAKTIAHELAEFGPEFDSARNGHRSRLPPATGCRLMEMDRTPCRYSASCFADQAGSGQSSSEVQYSNCVQSTKRSGGAEVEAQDRSKSAQQNANSVRSMGMHYRDKG